MRFATSRRRARLNQTAFMTNPTRAACGSCHDDVNFATGANHPGGPQFDDNECATCHIPQGEIDFDASILGAHVVPTESSSAVGPIGRRSPVSPTARPARQPTVSFTVQNSAGTPRPALALGSISFTMAGPTTDYGYTIFGSEYVDTRDTSRKAPPAPPAARPATCTYTVHQHRPGESHGNVRDRRGGAADRTVLLAGTTSQTEHRIWSDEPVVYFSVDGSPVASAARGGRAGQLQSVPLKRCRCTARCAIIPNIA